MCSAVSVPSWTVLRQRPYAMPTMEDHSLTTRYWWGRWMPCCHWVSSKAWTTPTTGLFCVRRLSQPLFQRTVSFYQASSFLKTMTERKDRRLMLHVKSVVQFREEEVKKALEFMPGSVPPTFRAYIMEPDNLGGIIPPW